MVSDKQAVDAVAAAFFGAFSNAGGAPGVDRLYGLFIPQAVIVKQTGSSPHVYDVESFVEPRRAILTGGTLERFVEEETSEQTALFENMAQRFSRYRKSWWENGKEHRGEGVKSLQFVRTPQGWKIASLVWEDVQD